MTRLDHNRAIAQLAKKTGRRSRRSRGHHLGQPLGDPVPGHLHAEVAGKNAAEVVATSSWLADTFIPTVRTGAAIIAARRRLFGASAALRPPSTTSHTWVNAPADGDWTSMGMSPTVPTASRRPDLLLSRSPRGRLVRIVQGLTSTSFAAADRRVVKELEEEREAVPASGHLSSIARLRRAVSSIAGRAEFSSSGD